MVKFIKYLKPYKLHLFISVFFLVLSHTLVAVSPFIEGFITNSIADSYVQYKETNILTINFAYITRIITYLVIIYVTVAISRTIYTFLLTKAIQSGIKELRNDVNKKINKLPIKYFDKNQSGNTMSRLTIDVETISNAMQQALIVIVSSITLIIVMVYVIVRMGVESNNYLIPFLIISIIPISYIAARISIKKSQNIFNIRFDEYGRLTGFLQEKYSGLKEIKLYNKEDDIIEEFKDANEHLAHLVYKSNMISGIITPVLNFCIYLVIVLIIISGGNDVLSGMIKLGTLQAFIRYTWRMNNPIMDLTQLTSTLQSSKAAEKRIYEFLNEKDESEDSGNILLNNVEGEIEFDNVSFSYFENKTVLKNVSFKVEKGKTIAIVGPTGSGKTTIINLLMRFYDLTEGKISIDGININEVKKDNLREVIGMVLQDTWLFNGTIFDNIKYGNENASYEDVIKACENAKIDHFIRTQPLGYNMIINEEADNISGGEKQLLTIARAFVSNPKILILDEATSTVDTRLEKQIQDVLKTLMQGRTSIVIAHRLSTIVNADKIVVLKDGEVIEEGKHSDLLKLKGFYYNMYNSQFLE